MRKLSILAFVLLLAAPAFAQNAPSPEKLELARRITQIEGNPIQHSLPLVRGMTTMWMGLLPASKPGLAAKATAWDKAVAAASSDIAALDNNKIEIYARAYSE